MTADPHIETIRSALIGAQAWVPDRHVHKLIDAEEELRALAARLEAAERDRDEFAKQVEFEQAMFQQAIGAEKPPVSDAANVAARSVAEAVLALKQFSRGYTLTKLDELALDHLDELAQDYRALAAAQEPPAGCPTHDGLLGAKCPQCAAQEPPAKGDDDRG